MSKIKKRRRSRKNQEYLQSFLFFLSSILSIVGLLVYLWVYTEIDETVIGIETQKQVALELQNSIDELEIEISQLSRGDRISRVARTELQMVPAKPETVMIYIDRSDIAQLND
jgi:cell division protein FtsL